MLWLLIRSTSRSTHNVCFYGETEKIIPELLSDTPPQQVLCRLIIAEMVWANKEEPVFPRQLAIVKSGLS